MSCLGEKNPVWSPAPAALPFGSEWNLSMSCHIFPAVCVNPRRSSHTGSSSHAMVHISEITERCDVDLELLSRDRLRENHVKKPCKADLLGA